MNLNPTNEPHSSTLSRERGEGLNRSPARLVVLVSDDAALLEALQSAVQRSLLPAAISQVIGNRRRSPVWQLCRDHDLPCRYLNFSCWERQGKSRWEFDAHVADEIARLAPDLIVMAGWLHVFSERFLKRFPERVVINIHPALPGAFPGATCIEDSWRAIRLGQVINGGAMVHFATLEVDAGPLIAIEALDGDPGESLEAYEHRLVRLQCDLLVRGIRAVLKARGWELATAPAEESNRR